MANRDEDRLLSHSSSSSCESDSECEVSNSNFPSGKDCVNQAQGHRKERASVKNSSRFSMDKAERSEIQNEDDRDESIDMYCDVCDKYMSGYISYSVHIKGSVHAKNLKKRKLRQQVQEMAEELENVCFENDSAGDAEGFATPFARCSTCQKEFSGPEPFQLHMKSATHVKRVKLSKALQALKSKYGVYPENEDLFSRCEVCQKTFTGFAPYQIHMHSAAHKKSLGRKKVAEEIEQFCSIADPENGYSCRECGKTFREPLAFKSHLLNNSHEKWKARAALIDFLSSYPEIVYSTPLSSEGSDDTDSKYFLICKLCSVVFSGPKSAREHVKSQKHIVRKENRRVTKLQKSQEKLGS